MKLYDHKGKEIRVRRPVRPKVKPIRDEEPDLEWSMDDWKTLVRPFLFAVAVVGFAILAAYLVGV